MSVFNFDAPQEAPAGGASSVFSFDEPSPTRAVEPEKPAGSWLDVLGAPGRLVQKGLGAVKSGVFGVAGGLGDILAPSENTIASVGQNLGDVRRGSFGARLKEAAAAVPDLASNALLGRGNERYAQLRKSGKIREAESAAEFVRTGGNIIEGMAEDPLTYAPIGAIAKVGKGAGQVALRAVSGGFAVQSGVGAVTGLDDAYRMFRESNYTITPEIASRVAEVTASGGMAGLATLGAISGHRPSDAATKIDEMRQAALREKMDAVAEGREPSPASVDIIGKIRELDLAKMRAFKIPKKEVPGVVIEEPAVVEGPPAPKFIRPALSRPGEPVLVDVERLDRAWAGAESNAGYVPATEITPRETMYSTIEKGRAVEMPEVKLGTDGGLIFEDGRQRLAALRDLGVKQIKVWVPKEDAALIRSRYTSGETPVPLAEMPPFEELGWKGFEAANDMPASVYASRLPKNPSPETPFKPVFKPQPGQTGGTASAAYRATHDIHQILEKIDPEAAYMAGGLISEREHLQSQAAYRVTEAGKLLTKEQQATARLDMDGKPRTDLSGGHAALGKFLDDLWQLGQETPEVADRLQRLGIPREENYVPRIPKEPITEAQKLKRFAEKLQKDAADNGTTLSEEDALAAAYRDKSAALRYADTTNALHLAGALEHARTGALDAPLKDGLDAFYSHGSRVAEHIAEMKWLGPQREKLQAILSRIGRPLSAAEAVGVAPEQLAATNAQRAANAKIVENAFDVLMGKDYGTFGKVASRAQRVVALVSMVRSAPKQMTTIFNTAAWGGVGNTARSTMKRVLGDLYGMEASARRSMATWPNESGEFGNQYGIGAGYIHGVNWADKQMRIIANDVSLPNFKAAAKGDKSAIARLETQGYFREAEYRGIPREKALELTPENIDIAGKTFTDFCQLRADPYNLSPWMDNPAGRMATQLVKFNINMGRFAYRAAKHSIANNDAGVFVRLIPAALAAGASSMTIGSLLARFGIKWTGDAEKDANTLVQARADPAQFLNKILSSRPIPWDRKHPETVVASLIQMLAASGSMGAYQTFIERSLGNPEDFGGVTFQKAFDLIKSAESLGKAGIGLAAGNVENAKKNALTSAKTALGTIGPYGGEISREFLGDEPSPEYGLIAMLHDVVDPLAQGRRIQQRTFKEESNQANYAALTRKGAASNAGVADKTSAPKPIEGKILAKTLKAWDDEQFTILLGKYGELKAQGNPKAILRWASMADVQRNQMFIKINKKIGDPAFFRKRANLWLTSGAATPEAVGQYGLKE